MPRIKDASVEAVKNAAEILPLVEDYVRLRKAGGTYKGLCPFHQEKTPSFTVSPARGTYKCFGCGEYGDPISFVEKLEQVDFVGAIETLAKRFGVQLEYEESSPEADRDRQRRDRLSKLLERATVFYERQLWDSEQGAFARAYLESRGLGEQVCRAFRLGFAPGGATLSRGAHKEGFTRDDLLATGLGNSRGNDYFQRRLLFPLADARGNIRGFQARKLYDDDRLTAKYVNSPESDLFKKGDLLYGLDGARQSIAKEDRAVVVEGNTDVIALRQAGFLPVVASMGTALTETQLKALQRLTKRVFLCFDSDAAGTEATLRGMELAVAQGFEVRVVPLPKGSDPADDPATFEERLAVPVSYLVHRVRLLSGRATDKQAAFAGIKLFLNAQPDSPEHVDARQLATDLLSLPPETQATFAPASSRSRATGVISPRLLEAGQRLERSALAGVAAHPSLNRYLESLSAEHFDLELHRRARAHLLGEEVADAELTAVIDELYALAGLEEINEQAGEQMLLRLQERHLQRQLNDARPDHMTDLQQRLAEVRTAIREFA